MLRLICYPLGVCIGDRFFAEAAARERGEALIVTASRALQQQARDRGLEAVSFDGLVKGVVRTAYRKFSLVSARTQQLFVEGWVRDLAATGKLRYFGGLAERPGFVQAVVGLLGQLARSGVEPDRLNEILSRWAEGVPEDGIAPREVALQSKDLDVALLYQLYRNYLRTHDVYDIGGLYRLAALALREEQVQLRHRVFYFYGFSQLDPLQQEVVKALRSEAEVVVGLPFEKQRRALYAATLPTYEALVGMLPLGAEPKYVQENTPQMEVSTLSDVNVAATGAEAAAVSAATETCTGAGTPVGAGQGRPPALTHLLATLGTDAPELVVADDSVCLHGAADQRSETAWVLAAVKTRLLAGTPATDIALVARDLNLYSNLRQDLDALGIPANLPLTTPLSGTPLLEYLQLFVAAQREQGHAQARAVLDFLTHPWQGLFMGLPKLPLRTLAQRHYVERAADMWAQAQQMEGVDAEASVIQRLRDSVEGFPKTGTVAVFCAALAEVVQTLNLSAQAGKLHKQGKLDLLALHTTLDAQRALVQQLALLPKDFAACGRDGEVLTLSDFWELLAETCREVSLTLIRGNVAGVQVLTATALDELRFPYVYVLGLREQEFPQHARENWLYDERERGALAALGLHLPVRAERDAQELHFFAAVCAAATRQLTLSWYVDETCSQSPYVEAVRALFMQESLRAPDVGLPAEPEVGGMAQQAAQVDWHRLQGQAAVNGVLADKALAVHVAEQLGTDLSASRLSAYQQCPFAFLAQQVWGLAATEEAGEDLDGGMRGSLLHRTLEHFVNRHLGERLDPAQYDTLRAELAADFAEACEFYIARGDIYAGTFWEADLPQLRGLLDRFLTAELAYAARTDFVPVATEVVFGGTRAGAECPLALTLDLPEGPLCITVQGRIDRVDAWQNLYFITDYKSGKPPAASAFLNGDLQLPLYILAAQTFLGGALRTDAPLQVLGGGYYGLKDAKRTSNFVFATEPVSRLSADFKPKRRSKQLPADMETLYTQTVEALSRLVSAMRQGQFGLTSGKCSPWCPVRDVCRKQLLSQGKEDGDE